MANGEQKNIRLWSKGTYVSLGLVVIIVGVVVFMIRLEGAVQASNMRFDGHVAEPALHYNIREYVENEYVRNKDLEPVKEDVAELRADVRAIINHFNIQTSE